MNESIEKAAIVGIDRAAAEKPIGIVAAGSRLTGLGLGPNDIRIVSQHIFGFGNGTTDHGVTNAVAGARGLGQFV